MKDQDKTKEQLVNELVELRQRVTELEAADSEHKRAEEEIERRNRELAALNAIATVVSQSLNLDEILNTALDKVLELLHLDVGGIYLADPVRRKLDLVVHRGISKEFAREVESISVDEKTLEAVTAEGRLRRFILSVEAVTKDRAELKRILSAMKREGLSLASGVPVLLQAREEILGLMIVASRGPRQFTQAELGLLTSIGQQSAVAIQNAWLYEEAVRRLARLSTLREIDRAISSSLELKDRLAVLLDHLTDLPHIDGVSVMVLEPGTKKLGTVAIRGLSEEFAETAEVRLRDGLPGLVAKQEKPLVIDDLMKDERVVYPDLLEHEGVASFVGLPLLAKGELIGILGIYSRERYRWSQEQTDFLRTLAGQAAIAIENARLYERAQQEITERKRAEDRAWHFLDQQITVNRLAVALGETRDLSKIYHIIYDHVRALMDAEAFIISRYDSDTRLIHAGYVITLGVVRDVADFPPIPLEEERRGTQSQVIHTGEPLYVPDYRKVMEGTQTEYDIQADGTVVEGPPPPEERDESTNSALYVPMKVEGQTIGVMQVQSNRLDAYSQENLDLLSALANVAAIAIQNARLYEAVRQELAERKRAEEALRRRAEELAALQATVLEITAPHDLPTLLHTIVERAAQLLDARCGGMYLCDLGRREAHCVVSYNTPHDYTGTILKYGEGAAGTVAQTREPLMIDDYRTWSGRAAVYEEEQPFTAVLSAPMIWQDQVTGVIHILDDVESKHFTEADLALLTLFANQAAIAIENARLYEAAQQELAERKRVEEALRESKQLLERTFASLHDAVFIIDVATTEILDCNPAASEIFGYNREEMLGRTTAFLHVDEMALQEFRAHLYPAVEEKGFLFLPEFRMKRKDGTVFPSEHSVMPLEDEIGKRIGWVSVVRDITERKQAEERILRQSAVLEAINTVFQEMLTCETDEEVARTCLAVAEKLTSSKFGFIGEVNPAGRVDAIALSDPGWDACRMPKTDAVVLLKDMEIRGIWSKVLKDEQSLIVNDPAAHPDRVGTPEGHPPLTCFLGVPLKQAGRTIGMIGLANKESGYDLANQQAIESLSVAFVEALMRKRAEVALAEERHLLRTLIDNLPDYIYAKDTESRLVLGNIAAAREVGVTTPDEMLGKTDFDFFPEELAAQYYADERAIFRSGQPLVNREEPVIDQAGNRLWVLTTKVPLRDSRGQIVGLVGINRDITERKRAEEELQRTAENLRRTLGATIQAMASTVETRDPYTAGHQRQVANLARAMATEMGLSSEQIEGIRMAAVIHDMGKITVPTDILNKPGRLNEHEFGIIKAHPEVAYNILKTVEFPWPIAQIIFQHHERMDGSGYPQGLSGEEIIVEARVLAVADVVEAMASFRPYRPALGIDKALEEISQNRGALYDPEVVDACLKLFTEKGFRFE